MPQQPDEVSTPAPKKNTGAARLVAAGILLSRLLGVVRERVFAYYFGTSLFADIFRGALRIPNLVQNLLGEGTLSASFIPVYAELLEQGREKEAASLASSMMSLLVALTGILALLGVVASPVLVRVFLPGFTGEKYDLSVSIVRVLFPMTGFLVLSAWALGILNSHRHFFLSYVAPAVWNLAMIVTLMTLGARLIDRDLVAALAWGALAGGVLQLAVQLPTVLTLQRGIHWSWDLKQPAMHEALVNLGPAILGRGVVQISSWIDTILASLLSTGALAALSYAQTLYLLPVSLFGMSVAAAELPELSRQRLQPGEVLRARVGKGLRQIAFFVVPSSVAYVLLGDLVVGALYQTGGFKRNDTIFVFLVLAAYGLGLTASTSTRLLSSTFFALHNTKTPAKTALLRVCVSATLGFALMERFETHEFGGHRLGAVGLALGTGVGAWLEWLVLHNRLRAAIGPVRAGSGAIAKMLVSAGVGAAASRLVAWRLVGWHPLLSAGVALSAYGVVYLALTYAWRLDEARDLLARFHLVRRV